MEQPNNNVINIIPNRIGKVTVSASEIIKKFRTLKDRESFCKESSKSLY